MGVAIFWKSEGGKQEYRFDGINPDLSDYALGQAELMEYCCGQCGQYLVNVVVIWTAGPHLNSRSFKDWTMGELLALARIHVKQHTHIKIEIMTDVTEGDTPWTLRDVLEHNADSGIEIPESYR